MTKCKNAYKEIQANKITHEKEKYDIYIKMKEQTHILKQTKRELKQKDTKLMVLQHKADVEFTKKQLAKLGEGSFAASKEDTESFFSTPSPDKKNKVKSDNELDESPQIDAKPSLSIKDGLKLVTDEEEVGE